MEEKTGVAERLNTVIEDIQRTARNCGRDPEDIQLLVVTKGHSPARLTEAIDAGAEMIGENYVQEALEKMEILDYPDQIRWHMIGHIQSNKARDVVEHFDFVQSLDRLKIARRLSRYSLEQGTRMPCLLECNLTGEETKYGWPLWNDLEWDGVFEDFSNVLNLEGIQVQGLMTMPSYHPDPEHSRPVFRRLVELRDELVRQFPKHAWEHLSMGMSDDYRVAIEEGATILRIGTAIMGPRTT